MIHTFAWVWQPIAPVQQILAGTLLVAALAVFVYARTWRERPVMSSLLLAMRLAVIAALGVLLLGPSRMPPQSKAQRRPRLCVLLDTSQSMLTEDCQDQTRIRYAIENWLSREQLQALSEHYQVELQGFDEQPQVLASASLERSDDRVATGVSTRLADSLVATLVRMPDGQDEAAVLVLSDGRDSEDAPIQGAAALAKSKELPVYTVALGGRSLDRDASVLAVPMQEYMLAGEPGAIQVKIYQSGLDDAGTTVRLRHGDQQQVVPVEFNGQRVVELQLNVEHEEAGQYEYTVEVDPIAGETEESNNVQTLFCDVELKRLKVLILEGQPFWDSKFLAQSLRKDERIELTQLTQLSAGKRETIVTRSDDAQATLPRTVNQWSEYDVVVLGRGLEQMLNEQLAQYLAEYVSLRGGHVVFSRGLPYDRDTPEGRSTGRGLEPLEPVRWGVGISRDLQLSLTPGGRTSQWFSPTKMGTSVEGALTRLPGFTMMQAVEGEKPATVVLARAATTAGGEISYPGLVTMNYGRGTVAAVLGEGLWKWSLLSAEKRDLTGFYDTFWSNLIRWLAIGGNFQPGQQVALHLSRTSARLGDPITVDAAFKQSPPGGLHPVLKLKDAAGKTQQLALAPVPGRDPRFRATLEPGQVGVHTVTLETPGLNPATQQKKFNVYHLNIERLETSANPMPLRVLAEHSGGAFFESDGAAAFLDTLSRHRASMLIPPQLEYIWDRGILMFLLLIWCGGEWLLRRTADLL